MGFPFGSESDPGATLSILEGMRAPTGAPVIAVLGLAGTVAAVAMARGRGRGTLRAALLALAWTVAAVLALAIPDCRVLVAVAYAPIILIGVPFGWPPGVSILDFFPWPVVNQYFCIAGGFLWAATAAAYGRRARGACGYCGRTTGADSGWTGPDAAARWGRWAVCVAVVIPVFYALTRWAWAPGIPLGISEELLREGQEVGLGYLDPERPDLGDLVRAEYAIYHYGQLLCAVVGVHSDRFRVAVWRGGGSYPPTTSPSSSANLIAVSSS